MVEVNLVREAPSTSRGVASSCLSLPCGLLLVSAVDVHADADAVLLSRVLTLTAVR